MDKSKKHLWKAPVDGSGGTVNKNHCANKKVFEITNKARGHYAKQK
jgi:hypothetical protein